MSECIINEPMLLAMGESGTLYLYLKNSKRYITMDQLKECKFEEGAKFVFYTIDEAPPNKHPPKKDKLNASYHSNGAALSFNTHSDYSLSPDSLKIQNFTLQLQKNEQRLPEPPDHIISSVSDFFIGGAASIAFVLSVVNQIRQKKKDAENAVCCNNNKLELNNVKVELEKVKQEVASKHEVSNKTMYAEIVHHYRELKETKEDLDNVKEILEKVIDRNIVLTKENKK